MCLGSCRRGWRLGLVLGVGEGLEYWEWGEKVLNAITASACRLGSVLGVCEGIPNTFAASMDIASVAFGLLSFTGGCHEWRASAAVSWMQNDG